MYVLQYFNRINRKYMIDIHPTKKLAIEGYKHLVEHDDYQEVSNPVEVVIVTCPVNNAMFWKK